MVGSFFGNDGVLETSAVEMMRASGDAAPMLSRAVASRYLPDRTRAGPRCDLASRSERRSCTSARWSSGLPFELVHAGEEPIHLSRSKAWRRSPASAQADRLHAHLAFEIGIWRANSLMRGCGPAAWTIARRAARASVHQLLRQPPHQSELTMSRKFDRRARSSRIPDHLGLRLGIGFLPRGGSEPGVKSPSCWFDSVVLLCEKRLVLLRYCSTFASASRPWCAAPLDLAGKHVPAARVCSRLAACCSAR